MGRQFFRDRRVYKLADGLSPKIVNLVVMAFIALNLSFSGTKVSASEVLLSGILTDGSFLSPAFITDNSLLGGGSFQNVDQLGLSGVGFSVVLRFQDSFLDQPLTNGLSFLVTDPSGLVVGSNLSVLGTLGDPSLGGFVFEDRLRSTEDIATFMDGVLSLELGVVGNNNNAGGAFLGVSPFGAFSLVTPQIPQTVSTVAQLAEFLQMTEQLTSGTLPVEFFVSSGPGDSMLVSADIPFEISGSTGGDVLDAEVPLPGAIWLFLTGVFGGGAFLSRKKRKAERA